MIRIVGFTASSILMVLIAFSITHAQVPEIISYQGVLSDGNGVPLTGSYDLTVSIYDSNTGGTPIWTEIHTDMIVTNGVFNIQLGTVNPFTEKVDFSKPYWLGVSINSGPELVPRTQFTSTGTALMAKKVMEGGVPSGMVAAFAMPTPPSGWLACNGQAVSRSSFPQLFAAIGTIYGNGNGSTTFNLPDLRGYFLRGWDQGRGIDPDRTRRTDRGDGVVGDNIGTKQSDIFANHRHSGRTYSVGNHSHSLRHDPTGDRSGQSIMYSTQTRGTPRNKSGLVNPSGAHAHSFTTYSAGGIETRPENINVLYCIKY